MHANYVLAYLSLCCPNAVGNIHPLGASSLLHVDTGLVVSVNAANEAINLAGALAQRYALLLAPLSLVQGVGGTAPLFVFLGVALALVYPPLGKEDLSPVSLVGKAVATGLVVARVSLVGA
jgi:hypothetical protein